MGTLGEPQRWPEVAFFSFSDAGEFWSTVRGTAMRDIQQNEPPLTRRRTTALRYVVAASNFDASGKPRCAHISGVCAHVRPHVHADSMHNKTLVFFG